MRLVAVDIESAVTNTFSGESTTCIAFEQKQLWNQQRLHFIQGVTSHILSSRMPPRWRRVASPFSLRSFSLRPDLEHHAMSKFAPFLTCACVIFAGSVCRGHSFTLSSCMFPRKIYRGSKSVIQVINKYVYIYIYLFKFTYVPCIYIYICLCFLYDINITRCFLSSPLVTLLGQMFRFLQPWHSFRSSWITFSKKVESHRVETLESITQQQSTDFAFLEHRKEQSWLWIYSNTLMNHSKQSLNKHCERPRRHTRVSQGASLLDARLLVVAPLLLVAMPLLLVASCSQS